MYVSLLKHFRTITWLKHKTWSIFVLRSESLFGFYSPTRPRLSDSENEDENGKEQLHCGVSVRRESISWIDK